MAESQNALLAGGGRRSVSMRAPRTLISSDTSQSREIPTIAVTHDPETITRKRYSYPAQVSPPFMKMTGLLDTEPNPVALQPSPGLTSQSTIYDPTEGQTESAHHLEAAQKPSRTRSFINRFNSIRSTFSSRSGGRYNEIEEEHGPVHDQQRSLDEVDEEDEPIGFDVSTFEGPIALRIMPSKRGAGGRAINRGLAPIDPARAGLIDESQRLEPEARSPGGGSIGDGLNNLIDRGIRLPQREPSQQSSRFTSVWPRRIGSHRNLREPSDVEARNLAQQQANEFGDIVAVQEVYDLSHFEGTPDRRAVLQGAAEQNVRNTRSYYFPSVPDMPDWKPMQMKTTYLTILIVVALFFGALQEWLCHLSIQRAKNNDGLIKFYSASEISVPVYFTWKYLPTIVLVSFGVMWQITDFEVKRLEPYHQLSKPTGATAAESLNMDYLTFLQFFVPWQAIKYRQWAVLCSSVATLFATMLVPVLQSAAVNIEPNPNERRSEEPKFVRIDPGWSLAMEVTLAIIAFCGIILLILLERRKSGLQSDPKGIAGVAAMATRSHILNDFQKLDTASNQSIHKQLRDRRYILHKSSLWQGEFIRDTVPAEDVKPEHPHPIMLRFHAVGIYIGSLILFLVLIPIFMFVPRANIATQTAPWLLVTYATILKLIWSTMEMDVRMIEPWYQLSRRNAPPQILTIDYAGTMPGVICFQAFRNGHFLVAIVGLCSLLTEVLTVCVSSFSVDGSKFIPGSIDGANDPNGVANGGETFRSFWVSFVLAMLIIMLLCVVAGRVYVKRHHKFVPREPGTIASVLAFIHQSKMLDDFVGTEIMNSGEITQYLTKLQKTYGLGWFVGRNGDDCCGVDEEPLISEYVHGMDWKKGRLGREQIGRWEHYETL